MIMVILNYPALLPTLKELQADKEKSVPFFENEVPGLVDKTWGMNEKTGRGVSVYHFEDRASAEAWFNSERQRNFREKNRADIEYFDVGAVAFKRPLNNQVRA
ncbi:MAG: YdhR family protein [Candidatus Binatia bacterium]|nr:YdhR family protein [Candidatus Binatia bacterium]